MEVKRSELIDAFVAAGLKNAGKMNRKDLLKKCSDFRGVCEADEDDTPEEVVEALEDLDEDQAKLLVDIMTAADDDEDIEIVDDKAAKKSTKKTTSKKSTKKKAADDDEEEDDDEEAPPKKKKSTKKKSKGAGTKKKSEVARDKFGNKEGSQAADINACFKGKKPVTVDKIVETTELKRGRVKAHLKWLEERNHIEDKGDGKYAATA